MEELCDIPTDAMIFPGPETAEITTRDVVLIPCWRRAEMLQHTLWNIERAHGAADLLYVFRVDSGNSEEVLDVIKGFPFEKEVLMTPSSNAYRFSAMKQSFSVLSGYELAMKRAARYVFLIEEDIFIAQDFFEWHYGIHANHRDRLFCSIAVANHNREMVATGAQHEYYLTTDDYCSWGVCWDKEVLYKYVLPWATDAYYRKPGPFLAERFAEFPLGSRFTEQDGLIRRLQWSHGIASPIAYPYQARAYHAGIYGYNRGKSPTGTLSDRIAWVSRMAYSEEGMRTFAEDPAFCDDSKPINLNATPCPSLIHKPLDLARNRSRL